MYEQLADRLFTKLLAWRVGMSVAPWTLMKRMGPSWAVHVGSSDAGNQRTIMCAVVCCTFSASILRQQTMQAWWHPQLGLPPGGHLLELLFMPWRDRKSVV